MKNLCLLLFTLLFSALTAQNVPQSVNYQSVIRSSNGAVIPNQPVEIKLSILQGSILGTYIYQEVHSTTTSNIGLVNVKLGEGLSSLSSFDLIDWSQEPFFLKVEIDTSMSGSFINLGESEISSVPFSLYAMRSAYTDSLSPLAISKLPKVSLSGDTLIIGSLDTIPLNLSSYNLTETEVDSMVSNNGYLLIEQDSSIINELQNMSLNNNILSLSLTGDSIDLIPYLDNTTLTEAQVDSLVSNNGFLSQEIDGSITNELQDLIISNDSLYLTILSQPNVVDLSVYYDNTNLSESQVDTYVSNNGYLTSEVDGSVTNEIQDLQLTNNTLLVTNNSSATSIDLSVYLDNTVLDETQVDTYVSNNGYLTSEIDGSITNEIQDLEDVLSQDNDANNYSILNVKRQSFGQQSIDTSAVVDINSTTQGLLPPRMTQAQRDAIYSPAAGLIIWCTDCGTNGLFSAYDGNGWTELQLTNSSGTVPTVSTNPIISFGYNSATVGGSVMSNGGSSVLAKGLCYSTSPNPNITDFVTPTDTGNGTMSYFLNYLDTNTTYYVRAYAQNQNGIGYGSQQSFTTKTTVEVGDTFGGGIVAYILQQGDYGFISGEQHGIIVSETDLFNQTVNFGWCQTSSATGYPEKDINILSNDTTKCSRGLLKGVSNLSTILNACNGTSNLAYIVSQYSLNGFNDWLIPTLDDLYAIKTNITTVNASMSTGNTFKSGGYKYWSSTTWGGNNAVYVVSFPTSYSGDSYLNVMSSCYIRPIRYF
jgi:hypothetical protein